MSKKLFLKTLSIVALLPAAEMLAQTYQTMPVQSGYTADVIANGVGSAGNSTTADLDGSSYAFVARDFQATATSTPITYGIPVNGIINSAVSTTSGLSYQLGSLSSNNSLRLANTGDSGTLVFNTPVAANQLYMLSTSGGGGSSVNITVTFIDNTTQVFSNISISDWYGGSNYAVQGLGRVNRLSSSLQSSSSDPRMYQSVLEINASNQSNPVQSVTIAKAGGGGISNIFAFSANMGTQLGTSDIKNTVKKISVYPNPFKDSVYMSDIKDVKSVTVGDASGKIVKTIDVPGKEINLNMLNSGLYFITLYHKDGSKSTIKTVKK